MVNMSDVIGKLARWLVQLSELDFEVVHGAGLKYQAADALSHFFTTEMDKCPFKDDVLVLMLFELKPGAKMPEQTRKFGIVYLLMIVWTLKTLPFLRFYICRTEPATKTAYVL